MSAYDKLIAPMCCPHCDGQGEREIDLYFGRRDLSVYRLGDRYRWADKRGPAKGGRPVDGNLVGEGYTQCRNCNKDFFVRVTVQGDVITDVAADSTRKGFIP